MDMQKLVDTLNAASMNTRAGYHLTLGAAIQALEEIAPSTPATLSVVGTPGKVRSYRGYYSDLAFEPELEPVSVGEVLADLKAALGATFEGYKGGDFVMGPQTPLWVSEWGLCSDTAVIDIQVIDGRAVFITKQVRD